MKNSSISINSLLGIFNEPNIVLIIDDGIKMFQYRRNDKEDTIPYNKTIDGAYSFSGYYILLDGVPYFQCIINI